MVAALVACGTSDDTANAPPSQPADATAAPADPVEPTIEQPSDPAAETEIDTDTDTGEQKFPDVIGASATSSGDSVWTISATISSPYDTPERYADAWRVVGPDGTVFGERILGHDHANEQPFTRSQSGITIPSEVTEVTIEGRDQQFGWGGATFQLMLPVD